MFNITIRYTQQISPDDFAVRYKMIALDIPELEQHYKESGSSYMTPHIVDVQDAKATICPGCGGTEFEYDKGILKCNRETICQNNSVVKGKLFKSR